MDADLARGAFAGDALTSVTQRFLKLDLAHVTKNFEQRGGGAAGSIFFQAVVHLHHFEVEAGAENFRRLAREPEERVHAGRVVGGPDDGDLRFETQDFRLLGGLMSGRADDERLAVLRANFRHVERRAVKAEIDHGIAAADDVREIVARVDLADHFEFGQARRATEEGLAHAAFGTGDDYFCHVATESQRHGGQINSVAPYLCCKIISRLLLPSASSAARPCSLHSSARAGGGIPLPCRPSLRARL